MALNMLCNYSMTTILMLLSLTVYVDQCDAGRCSVITNFGANNDPIMVPQSALPACAQEGVYLLIDGSCHDTYDEPSEAPRTDAPEYDADDVSAPADHAAWCPATAPTQHNSNGTRATDDGADIKL